MSKRCMGCMEEYDDELEVCPYCGYVEGTKAKVPYHIQPGAILVFRYIVGKVLGYGSFGVTYLGWDCLLEKKIAIKEYLPNEFATRAEGTSEVTVFDGEKAQQFTMGKDKFSDEAKKLAAFNKNKGIITVYDQFEDNGTSYIVMDYFEGETLQERLNREGKIAYEEAVEIMMPILSSLQEVHDAGIIHRDISPDNIYLTKDGEVKLLDFGAARYASTNMSKSLSAIYKQGFAPYEQYQSSREQGPWSDVYALGATLYYMLTGNIPQEAMNRLTKEDDKLVSPRKIDKEIPRNLSNAIMNAMIVYPQQRTQSVTEFKREIEDVQTEIKKTKYPKKFLIPLWAKITTGATTATLVTLCILIAFGVIDLSSILGNGSSKTLKENETYIPGILNMSLADAQEEAEDAEVVLQITDKVQSEKVDANKVMSQDPKPGLIMIKDGLVNVVVSKGETQAVVPDVTYMKEEMAKQLIENAGFKVKIKNADLKGVAPGTVGKQNIEGNTIYDIGSTITLTVSNNKSIKGNGKVGSYVNKKLSSAVSSANKQGLYIVVIERKYDDKVKEGHIISQSAEKGTKLEAGSIVEVVVSLGKEKVLVPDVQYNDFNAAKGVLEGLGLKIEKKEEESDVVQEGKIISQSIKANTRTLKGDTIVLTVSKGSKVLADAQKKTDKFNNSTSFTTNSDGKVESITVDDKVEVPVKNWSDWTTDSSKVGNSNYYVESKTQYRSRIIPKTYQTTVSSSSSLSGWTYLSKNTNYSNWVTGGWQRNTRPTGDLCQLVNQKTVTDRAAYNTYKYWRYRQSNSNRTHFCLNLAKQYYGGSWYQEYSQEYSSSKYIGAFGQSCSCHGRPNYYVDSQHPYFYEIVNTVPAVTHQEYQYKTRTVSYTYNFYRYVEGTPGSWGAWQDTKISSSNTNAQKVEVETRTIYRYKQK